MSCRRVFPGSRVLFTIVLSSLILTAAGAQTHKPRITAAQLQKLLKDDETLTKGFKTSEKRDSPCRENDSWRSSPKI